MYPMPLSIRRAFRAAILMTLLSGAAACPGRNPDLRGIWSVAELDRPDGVHTWTFYGNGAVDIDTALYPVTIEAEYTVRGNVVTVTGLAEAAAGAPPMYVSARLILSDDATEFTGDLTLAEPFIPPHILEAALVGSRAT